ncbi:MAG: L-serine ammonia-lyase [SAR324 cluster bacterium]|nr:L-serine ammonia-lyase [SAR324 cluster bacterium]MBL7035701.1 L-serine ammonia-lyase [SAR324 cluster bacterium]
MSISVFDLFKIGIGPSSSHTVGPMFAAKQFIFNCIEKFPLTKIDSVKIELFGSLALTGTGHGTKGAILLGLEGADPATVETELMSVRLGRIRKNKTLTLLNEHKISFDEKESLIFYHDDLLPHHSNGMRFTVYDVDGTKLREEDFYSVGGGFVLDAEEIQNKNESFGKQVPFHFKSCKELFEHCTKTGMSCRELMWINEQTWRSESEIWDGLLNIWGVMQECTQRGMSSSESHLPGGLNVRRRAPDLYRELMKNPDHSPAELMDWVSLFAMAVNEENASGGRIVTAPTNGGGGVIPAVMHYCQRFRKDFNEDKIVTFLLTAAAIGILFKEGASISAAEVGCQGEVGVACSMAAAGLAAVMDCAPRQIANAAEIGMEHNLGLTCDPVGGLVQIPCIERNTMGALKAINAARLARRGDGNHIISLDKVIATMHKTGKDMMLHYKETSLGGLAVNLPEC